MLTFLNEWRFEAPGDPLPSIVINQFDDLISRVASQGDRWSVIEFFKARFAGAAGVPSYTSSSLSWAEGDLANLMQGAAENAPLFIDAFCKACVELREQEPNWGFPTIGQLNRVLSEAETGYAIQPPNLVFTGMQVPIIKPERPPSLDEQAQQLIQRSLDQSQQLLREGRGRQAVSEILWLLETVSTAFRGLDAGSGTIEEKYFNRIAGELRRQHRGQVLEQVVGWMTTLYGFLSSPTGGRVRHGADITNTAEMPRGDAELYCNLIRSYLGYLMAEHDRISRAQFP
jgi:hypothetical protein